MSGLHRRYDYGNDIGVVEIDYFGFESGIYLDLNDTSGPGEHSGCVVLTPKQARKLGKALIRAAKMATPR